MSLSRLNWKNSVIVVLILSLGTPSFADSLYELLDELTSARRKFNPAMLVQPEQISPVALGQLGYFKEDGFVRVGVIRKVIDADTVKVRWKRKEGQAPVLWRPTALVPTQRLARQVTHEYDGKTVFVPAYHYYLKVGKVSAVFQNNRVEIDYGAHRPRMYFSLRDVSPTQLFPEQGQRVVFRSPGKVLEGRAIRWFENDLVEVEWEKENGLPFCSFTISPYAYLSDPPERHFLSRSRLEFVGD